jgi:hypothetical protein
LNEPAGHLAKIILVRLLSANIASRIDAPLQINAVNLVIKAWDTPSMDVRAMTDEILECLCVHFV